MSDLNNKSLNDLFRSAGAEAEGDVISQREVERLIQTGKRSVPVTQSIGQQLFERLLSTPLKIGMTAMTIAACITLGLLAFWPTPQKSTTTATKAPIMSDRTYGSQGTDGVKQHYATPPKNKPSFVASQPNKTLPALPKLPAMPIVTADSLHPIELSPEQLAQLGIVLEDNGDIDFYTREVSSVKDSHGDSTVYVSHYGLPPTWGLRVHFLAHDLLTPKDLPGIHCLTMMPKLVTEPDGSKRLFSFESDGPSKFKNGNFHTQEIKNFTDENGKTDVLPVFDDDSTMNIRPKNVGPSGRLAMHRILRNDASAIVSDDEHHSIDSIVRYAMKIAMDTLKNFQVSTIDVNEIDSSIGIKNPKNFHTTIQTIDTEEVGSPKNIAIFEKMIKVSDSTSSSQDGQRSTLDSAMNRAISTAIDSLQKGQSIHIPDVDSEYNSFVNNPIEFDRLIPIRVVNLKNAEHPNELIFWYEPSPELTAAMPSAMNASPTPSSKQLAISVYPNPTAGPATIHYQLSDAPRAYFSVRNLLGQEVMNGGMISGTSGDAPLDLSQLPAGVYLLVTTTGNGERDVERVVVTK